MSSLVSHSDNKLANLIPLDKLSKKQIMLYTDITRTANCQTISPSYTSGSLGLPTYSTPAPQLSDEGRLNTSISTTDLWTLNCVLTHLPMIACSINKTLKVFAHYPNSNILSLTFSYPLSASQEIYFLNRVETVAKRGMILLFDSNSCKVSNEGYRFPKAWLHDVYKALAFEIDKFYNTNKPTSLNDSNIFIEAGRIYYVRYRNDSDIMVYRNVNMELVTLDTITEVIYEYTVKMEEVLNRFYDEGLVGSQAAQNLEIVQSPYEDLVYVSVNPLINVVEMLYS